jgi:hypothetical protein
VNHHYLQGTSVLKKDILAFLNNKKGKYSIHDCKGTKKEIEKKSMHQPEHRRLFL